MLDSVEFRVGGLAKVEFLIGFLARRLLGDQDQVDFNDADPQGGQISPTGLEDVVAIDVETTGLDSRRDRIVELALVGLTGEGDLAWQWESLINPERPVPLSATQIHGIRDSDLVNAPVFSEVSGAVEALLAEKVLLAHNLRFDAGFLHAEFRRCGLAVPTNRGIDTLQMSRQFDANERSHKLADACRRYGVYLSGGHRAKQDAMAVAQLFVAMCERNEDHSSGFSPGTYRIG